MKYGESSRLAMLAVLLIVAGTLLPIRPAKAEVLTWINCYYVNGGVDTGSGNVVYTDIVCQEITYNDGAGDFGGDDPVGGGPNPDQNTPVCSELGLLKPDNCPNPMPQPSGWEYGRSELKSGTGLAVLISLADSDYLLPVPKQQLQTALANHTKNIAAYHIALVEANAELLEKVKIACQNEAKRAPGTEGLRLCLDGVAKLENETHAPGIVEDFEHWLEVNDISLSLGWSFGVGASVAFGTPDNSLSKKYEVVTHDKQCHDWWEKEAVCGI